MALTPFEREYPRTRRREISPRTRGNFPGQAYGLDALRVAVVTWVDAGGEQSHDDRTRAFGQALVSRWYHSITRCVRRTGCSARGWTVRNGSSID